MRLGNAAVATARRAVRASWLTPSRSDPVGSLGCPRNARADSVAQRAAVHSVFYCHSPQYNLLLLSVRLNACCLPRGVETREDENPIASFGRHVDRNWSAPFAAGCRTENDIRKPSAGKKRLDAVPNLISENVRPEPPPPSPPVNFGSMRSTLSFAVEKRCSFGSRKPPIRDGLRSKVPQNRYFASLVVILLYFDRAT